VRAVNLLPRPEARAGAWYSSGRRPLFAGAGAAVMLVGLFAVLFVSASRHVDRQRNELAAAREELVAVQSQAKPSEAARLVAERDRRVSAVTAVVSERLAWDRLLPRVSQVLPEGVWLTALEATAPSQAAAVASGTAAPVPAEGSASFSVTGFAYTQRSVARTLARLGALPDLTNVRLLNSTRADDQGRKLLQFRIAAELRRVGGPA